MKTAAMIGMLALAAGQAAGQCELTKTRPNDCNQGDGAGYAVGISGDILLMGTWKDDEKAQDAGAVHVMTRPYGHWQQVAKLMTKYGQAGDLFGSSIAFNGFFAIVGAPLADPYGVEDAGSATVFFHWGDSWYELTRLLINNYAAKDYAGTSVAMSGYWALIGAPPGDDTIAGLDAGSASFVSFDQNGVFNVQPKTTPADGEQFDQFGQAVAMDGEWAAVGAPLANKDGKDSCGKVYMYHLVNGLWQTAGELAAPDRMDYDHFGQSIAISGDVMAIGAPFKSKDNWITYAGAAYFYRYSNGQWVYESKATGRGQENDSFGWRTAVAGGAVFVSTINAERVFSYEKLNGSWQKIGEMLDPDANGSFGSDLATDGSTLAIGDSSDDYTLISQSDNGASYTIGIKPYCTADFNSDGVTDIFDFLAFQNAFVAQQGAADMDCNGTFDLFDFLGFQNQFVAGCE